jgi:hypothetical protein
MSLSDRRPRNIQAIDHDDAVATLFAGFPHPWLWVFRKLTRLGLTASEATMDRDQRSKRGPQRASIETEGFRRITQAGH